MLIYRVIQDWKWFRTSFATTTLHLRIPLRFEDMIHFVLFGNFNFLCKKVIVTLEICGVEEILKTPAETALNFL